MAYDRYVTEFNDNENRTYGVMDAEAREEVSNVKSAINENVEYLEGRQSFTLASPDFVNGEYYASDGTIGSTQYKLRTTRLLRVSNLKPYYWTITPGSTFSIRIVQYDKNSAYITGETMSSRTITLNANTEYIGIVIWKGNTVPVSPSDVTSVSFDTYANDQNNFPLFIEENIPESNLIHISGFVSGQYYDHSSSGNIKADANKSRSVHLYKVTTRSRLLSTYLTDCEIIFYDKNFAYLNYSNATGLNTMPAGTAYFAVNVNDTSVTALDLHIISKDNVNDITVRMDIGGINESNGKNAFLYEKNPLSYRRTTKFLRIKQGVPFRIEFTGTLYVYEYGEAYWFIQRKQATSNAFYFPDKLTTMIKLESYVAPTYVSSPSINIGYKSVSQDKTQWVVDSTDTDLCYSDNLNLDHSKKYLMTVDMDNVILSLAYSLSDDTPLKALPFTSGDQIVDCLSYLNNGEKVFVRADTSAAAFSASDKPFSIYELTENTLDKVVVKGEWHEDGGTTYNKRYNASEHALVYPVHPLIGGVAPTDPCYTAGLLKLPPNYSQIGKPVPLIYFAHGSSDYNSINVNVLSPASRYAAYIDYLCDEGYAVFDCYGWSNLLSFAGGGQWAGHVGMACVTSGIAHVIENYNVDPNHVYVTGKSLGGLQSLNMATFGNVKAVAPLAPAVDSFEDCLGYDYAQRKATFYDFGLDAGTDDANINFTTSYMYNAPEAFMTAVLAQPDALAGYNPAWNAVYDIDHAATITAEHESTSFQSGALNVANILKLKNKFNKAPVKIWCASDDNAVSYRLCSAYVQSIKKAGGIAELRTMPDNTGGHHSVDNDPNAPKVASITTALGITHTNVPVAYVEMVQWFRQYE